MLERFYLYLNVDFLCEESFLIFIHTKLNFGIEMKVKSLTFRYTRQRFVEEQPFVNTAHFNISVNCFALWRTCNFAYVTFWAGFHSIKVFQ